jgi:hypothetical protein
VLPAGWTTQDAANAFVLAAEEWNNAGAGKTFTYDGRVPDGLTPDQVVPLDASACSPSTPDCCTYSVVNFFDGFSTGAEAYAAGGTTYCRDGAGVAHQFRIQVFLQDQQQAPYPYSFDPNGAALPDLPSILTHEFGHVTGFGHDDDGTDGVNPLMGGFGTPYRLIKRQAGEWELTCHDDSFAVLGQRELRPRSRLQVWGTTSAEFDTFDGSVVQIGQGAIYSSPYGSGDFSFDSAFASTSSRVRINQTSSGGGLTRTLAALDYAVDLAGWALGVRRDAPSLAYAVFNSGEDVFSGLPSETDIPIRAVNFVRSADDFVSMSADTPLEYCTSQYLGSQACVSETAVAQVLAIGRVTFAWDPVHDVSIVAWVRDSNDLTSVNRYGDVLLSIGPGTLAADDAVLPKPQVLPSAVRSVVPVGVACADQGEYNCVLLYVGRADPTLQLMARNFRVAPGTGQEPFLAHLDPAGSTAVNTSTFSRSFTGAAIAAWFNDGYFWVAIRSAGRRQPLRMYRRAVSSSSWSAWLTDQDATVVAPSAPAFLDPGVNQITYAYPVNP